LLRLLVSLDLPQGLNMVRTLPILILAAVTFGAAYPIAEYVSALSLSGKHVRDAYSSLRAISGSLGYGKGRQD
jgi:hypothetical protein